MEHAFIFSIIITIKLGLIAGLVAYFDTMHMKDRILENIRADEDEVELYDGIK